MTLPARHGPRADITVYRWSERSLTGRGDVGPVASSLDRDDLLRWNSRIEHMVWATQEHPGDTAPGFVYLVYEREAAVLRKLPVRDPHGRAGSTLTHVLTGPADGIDLYLALAACRSDWDAWLPPQVLEDALRDGPEQGEPVQRVPLDRLRGLLLEEDRLLADLDEAAADLPDELLVRLTEAVLEHPGAPLTVAGSPVDCEVVVHALAGLLGRVVLTPWTFATREENDGAKDLPSFVFVRGDGGGSLQSARRRIDAKADPGPPGPMHEVAAWLIGLHRRGGLSALGRVAPAHPMASAERIRDWAAGQQVAPGLMNDVLGLLETAPHGGLTQKEDAYLSSPTAVPRVQLEVQRMTSGQLARLVALWRPNTLELKRYRHLRSEIHALALHRCLDIGSPDLIRELAVTPPDDPVALRVFRERLEHAALRRTEFDVVPLLRTAHEIGVSPSALTDMMKVLVDRLPLADLLKEIDRISKVAPAEARALLENLPGRRGTGKERRDPFDVLRPRLFLADAVDRMAPNDPWRAVHLYRVLLLCTVGNKVGQREVLTVLDAAGRRPSAALLYALADSCRGGKAQDTVYAVVAQQYFADQLPSRPPDGKRPGAHGHGLRD